MRLKLIFQLENNTLDIQYRKSIISWIKHALQSYDENLFQEIYNNYIYGLHLYNSFVKQKFQKFSLNKNSMKLTSIIMLKEREINEDTIVIKMSSPIICRNHDKTTLKDMYYAYDREEFQKYIRINIEEQLIAENLNIQLLNDFEIIPINAKKLIIPVYEKMIECSLGIFELHGSIELLKYLYKAGIGSKKAMGFGLFEIIQ